jgi:hypothetical protein
MPARRLTTIDGRQVYDFPAVNARYVRLNILEASDVPTIEEFQLMETPRPPGRAARQPEGQPKINFPIGILDWQNAGGIIYKNIESYKRHPAFSQSME